MASTVHRSPRKKKLYIPRISIEPFLKDPDSAASKAIVEDVRAACQSTGFLEITGHGIPKTLQKDVFGAARQFFKLPFDEKKKLDASKQIGYRGYDMLASQAYGKDLLPDLKEVCCTLYFLCVKLAENEAHFRSISLLTDLPGLLHRHRHT